MNKTEKKREREKKTVSEMIALRHVIENKREKRRLEKENEY